MKTVLLILALLILLLVTCRPLRAALKMALSTLVLLGILPALFAVVKGNLLLRYNYFQ